MFINLRNEKGSTLVLSALILPVLVAVSGLLLDFGVLAVNYTKLSNAVDSSAIAALKSYDEYLWENENLVVLDENESRNLADQYLQKNLQNAILTKCTVTNNKVDIEAEFTSPVFFMKLFGVGDIKVSAKSSAKLG
jgi:Flp pilus assembly protein TadG